MNENLDSFVDRRQCEKRIGWNLLVTEPPIFIYFNCFCGCLMGPYEAKFHYLSKSPCPQCHQKFIIKKENDEYWVYKNE